MDGGATYFEEVKTAILNWCEVTPEASRVKLWRLRFQLRDDIAKANMYTKRWLIPMEPDEDDAECIQRMERRITEITKEQVYRGLPQELQARVQARGPRDLNELSQCQQSDQRVTFPRTSVWQDWRTSLKPPRLNKPSWHSSKRPQLSRSHKLATIVANQDTLLATNHIQQPAQWKMVRQGKINRQAAEHIRLDKGSSLTPVHRTRDSQHWVSCDDEENDRNPNVPNSHCKNWAGWALLREGSSHIRTPHGGCTAGGRCATVASFDNVTQPSRSRSSVGASTAGRDHLCCDYQSTGSRATTSQLKSHWTMPQTRRSR